MTTTSDQHPIVLETRDVGKSFGVIRALQGVSFSLKAGEVHGLVGENGAGKSTLIKILTGFYQPDSGAIILEGRAVHFSDPRASQRAGVSAVYQEINLVPERSVAENIFLGREPKWAGVLIDRGRMGRHAAAVLQRYGLHIDPGVKLSSLGLGLQQMVSIARVVSLGAKVVIMDEPTSALSGAEVTILYDVVRRLRDEGIAILFVSHRLSECYHLCDRLTVLRDGQSVRSGTPAELPRTELIAAMLGQQPGAPRGQTTEAREKRRREGSGAAPVMQVRNLRWRERVRDVSLDVRPREILGLAGLLGSGRTETFKAIFGAERPDGGHVEVAGEALRHPTPAELDPARRRLPFGGPTLGRHFSQAFGAGEHDGRRAAAHLEVRDCLAPQAARAGAAVHRRAGNQDGRAAASDFRPFRRQPAEGAAGPVPVRAAEGHHA